MATANAQELKPSEERSLQNTLDSLTELNALLSKAPATSNERWDELRKRDIKKATSALKRAERTLARLPAEHLMVTTALETAEELTNTIEQANKQLFKLEAYAKQQQVEQLNQTNALLESPDTADNIARMKSLSDEFKHAWHTFDKIDDRFTHGLFKLWDEAGIGELIYSLSHSQPLLEEASLLLDAYKDLAKTREGAFLLLAPTSDLRRNRDEFTNRLPGFVSAFPLVQEVAAVNFGTEVTKQQTIFREANKSRDTSALLNLNPRFPQLDALRNRMLAQELIYDALGGPHAQTIRTLRSKALALAESAGSEISDWQSAQQGHEAQALAQQQAEYDAQSQLNQARAEADRLAWQERRAQLDSQREAQQLRNQELRKVSQ